eukprot:729765-Rhodomonas_salina.1
MSTGLSSSEPRFEGGADSGLKSAPDVVGKARGGPWSHSDRVLPSSSARSTDVAYGVLSAYAAAVRCPVLTYAISASAVRDVRY